MPLLWHISLENMSLYELFYIIIYNVISKSIFLRCSQFIKIKGNNPQLFIEPIFSKIYQKGEITCFFQYWKRSFCYVFRFSQNATTSLDKINTSKRTFLKLLKMDIFYGEQSIAISRWVCLIQKCLFIVFLLNDIKCIWDIQIYKML